MNKDGSGWVSGTPALHRRVIYLYRQFLFVLSRMASSWVAGFRSILVRCCQAVDIKKDLERRASERGPRHQRRLKASIHMAINRRLGAFPQKLKKHTHLGRRVQPRWIQGVKLDRIRLPIGKDSRQAPLLNILSHH
jgi:hypothetical protein